MDITSILKELNVCNMDLCCEIEESKNEKNVTTIRCKKPSVDETNHIFLFGSINAVNVVTTVKFWSLFFNFFIVQQ